MSHLSRLPPQFCCPRVPVTPGTCSLPKSAIARSRAASWCASSAPRTFCRPCIRPGCTDTHPGVPCWAGAQHCQLLHPHAPPASPRPLLRRGQMHPAAPSTKLPAPSKSMNTASPTTLRATHQARTRLLQQAMRAPSAQKSLQRRRPHHHHRSPPKAMHQPWVVRGL